MRRYTARAFFNAKKQLRLVIHAQGWNKLVTGSDTLLGFSLLITGGLEVTLSDSDVFVHARQLV